MTTLPPWPGRHTMPAPLRIRWSDRSREALNPSPFPPPECLWSTASPAEIPLVLPAWARHQIPGMAEALDAGYELRRAAGLPE